MDQYVENLLQSQENLEKCRKQILSDDYIDLITELGEAIFPILGVNYQDCIQQIDERFYIVHYKRNPSEEISIERYSYTVIPKLYGLVDTSSMEASGITQIHNQPYAELDGRNVLIGFVDTGIDYTHPVFRYKDGSTRIVSIWDQTIQTGTLPEGFWYGSEYTKEKIDEALKSDQPFEIVPSRDENGHGTFIAGIAAGSKVEEENFTGAAPGSMICAVKLKPAKKYLRDFYLIKEGVPVFQETDIMMGIRYLLDIAQKLSVPLVILVALGSNMGGHVGNTNLGRYLDLITRYLGIAVVTATGNEGNRGGHYSGNLIENQEYEEVELLVGENENGFCMEIWTQLPDHVTVSLISPTGEVVPKMSGRIGENFTDRFLFERTVVYTNFRMLGGYMGENLIFMRFLEPTPGIWRLRVYPTEPTSNRFDIWLPLKQFMTVDTRFLQPDPYITLTEPSAALRVISVATYNHQDNSIYLYSGRGYTRSNYIKPDIAAPGVDVYGPIPGGRYTNKSGSSVAAAHVAGAAAIFLSWGYIYGNDLGMDTGSIKGYLIRGAKRKEGVTYPNRLWGFGSLDLYRSFEVMRIME